MGNQDGHLQQTNTNNRGNNAANAPQRSAGGWVQTDGKGWTWAAPSCPQTDDAPAKCGADDPRLPHRKDASISRGRPQRDPLNSWNQPKPSQDAWDLPQPSRDAWEQPRQPPKDTLNSPDQQEARPVNLESGWDLPTNQADVVDPNKEWNKQLPRVDEASGLADWSGGWAPPPVDWDMRPPFSDPTKLDHISEWAKDATAAVSKQSKVAGLDLLDPKTGTIAPSYWIYDIFDQRSLEAFWAEIISYRDPYPVDQDDLVDAKPWWDYYVSRDPSTSILKIPQAPTVEGIDPLETPNQRLARENDRGSDFAIENKKRTERAKAEAARERRRRAAEKSRKIQEKTGARPPDPIKMELKIHRYLRPARLADMKELRDIYNYYIDLTWAVPETERINSAFITKRMNAAISNNLPFIVAVERGVKIGGGRKKRPHQEEIWTQDRIIGFAFAEDYHDPRGMYRFAVQLKIFTNRMYYLKNVGNCLMDKLLGLLDTMYLEKGGYVVEDEEIGTEERMRKVSTLVAEVPYEREDRLRWMSHWLTERFGFTKVGDVPNLGVKLGRDVGLATFARKTGIFIDAAEPPPMLDKKAVQR
ncbi:hypothetical protein K470DRAFT_217500 [Piedraia hortae CBS 480.64]|uniref:N-acetyltransferase domain-containing protein n=1 Tax=Piedraia hortae CBS 480.64 TaxID=1314780 RepID=A0A6A7BY65_9PEZI|nr:hypothetical protein K470DRAFT_217500 [Piedraia hortae CBS 480.64]